MRTLNHRLYRRGALALAFALVLSIPALAVAQERAASSGPVYRETLQDLTARSNAAEATLKELSAMVEMAISCNEQSMLYQPVAGTAGTCISVPLSPVVCPCSGTGGSGTGGSGSGGNAYGSGSGSGSSGGEDYQSRTGDWDNDASNGTNEGNTGETMF